ncbi:MAG TPA: RDD family protein [Stellaceae bacterium]|nr:RDD family protein [Stellaceae bacterium]
MSAAHDRTSLFLDGVAANRREIISPEGVPLPVEIADVGERVTAFALDLFIWLCATIVLVILFIVLAAGGFKALGLNGLLVAATATLFIAFVVRNLYFIHFELSWQGATPGKRIVGLRVIDRSGGPLLPGAVIARNLTREIETFMPLGILLTLSARNSLWQNLLLGGWLLLFAALPLFNRDRLRAGDLIAGTIVIALPKRVLLGDLVDTAARFQFSGPQLGAYGAFELQILEELLRRPESAETRRLRRDVTDKIRRKIGFAPEIASGETAAFLRDFYTAERAFLEREQLFGKPRADKNYGKPEA